MNLLSGLRLFPLAICTFCFNPAHAQKKLMPVSISTLSGIGLPTGSKLDQRALSVGAARQLLELESKSTGLPVKQVEVLYLPKTFVQDSIATAMSAKGWKPGSAPKEKEYSYWQKNGRQLLAYADNDGAQQNLYLGELGTATNTQPTTNNQQPTTNTQQPTTNTQPTTYNLQPTTYSYSTTNFDNGWTAVALADGVELTKGSLKVRLPWIMRNDPNIFTGTGLAARDYYWDQVLSKYFAIETKQYRDPEIAYDLKPDYVEGWCRDKRTNERRFVAMRLIIGPGTATLVIASAPSEQDIRQTFPNAYRYNSDDLSAMLGYNRFAVGPNDVLGTWEDAATGTAHWYYASGVNAGSYAGMTFASTAATFRFGTGGKYSSSHSGATGSVAHMSTFQQEYKGEYTVENWAITATNRFEGKTSRFDAWFVAVEGGRILKLADGGSLYTLVKVK